MQQERASKKQQELLHFVDTFIKGNGYGPSYREIMRSLGYKSVSTVAIHVDNLIAKGYLRRKDKSARSLEVVTLQSTPHASTQSPDWKSQLHAYIEHQELSEVDQARVNDVLSLLNLEKDSR